jgi:hypothetical protein
MGAVAHTCHYHVRDINSAINIRNTDQMVLYEKITSEATPEVLASLLPVVLQKVTSKIAISGDYCRLFTSSRTTKDRAVVDSVVLKQQPHRQNCVKLYPSHPPTHLERRNEHDKAFYH